MKKHTYRSKNVNKIDFSCVKEQLAGESVVFVIDVANEKQYALLSDVKGRLTKIHFRLGDRFRNVHEIT